MANVALVAVAAASTETASFWDNSTLDGPHLVATLVNGHPLAHPEWPTWAPDVLVDRWLG